MISRPIQIAVAMALLVALWFAFGWYTSAEQQIHRRTQHMQRLVAKTPRENDVAGLATAKKIADLFAEPFTVRTDPEGYSATDRRTLIAGIHQYRSRSLTLVMEISGEEIYVDEAGTGANSFFTARFLNDLTDLRRAERYDVRIHWIRSDGDWLIDDVQVSNARP